MLWESWNKKKTEKILKLTSAILKIDYKDYNYLNLVKVINKKILHKTKKKINKPNSLLRLTVGTSLNYAGYLVKILLIEELLIGPDC